jgi:hypothetical protein
MMEGIILKKIVLLAVALIVLCASSAFAGYPEGYIGLFTDEAHTNWCATGTGFYPVEMWIWALPNALYGTICAEFRICYPVNVIQSTATRNDPIISVMLGDLASGISVCFIVCQWSWFWICHQLLYVTDPTQTIVYICAHPDVGVFQFANCEPGYPVEPFIKFTSLYLNYAPPDPECMGTATEDASWGAIKSMME